MKGPSEPSEVDSENKYFDKIEGFENKKSIKKGLNRGLKRLEE